MNLERLLLRRALAALAAASLLAALALPAIATAAHVDGLRGWALLLRGWVAFPVPSGIGWAGVGLLAPTLAWQWRGRAAPSLALGGLLVAAFAVALSPRDWLPGAWCWAAALVAAWVGSGRWLDAPPSGQAAASATAEAPAPVPDSVAVPPGVLVAPMPLAPPRRRWRPGRRFWLWTIGLWMVVALRDRAIDLFVPADEVRRTTAGPVDAVELLREGGAAASPMLDRSAAAAAGYREVVVGPRRYRAALGADGYFVVAPAGPAPRWLVVERRSRTEGFWSRRLRRFASLRIVDRERGETVATWHGPVTGRGVDTDAGQAAAFVRSILSPGPPTRAPQGALHASVRIEPSTVADRPGPRLAGCAPDVRLVEAAGGADPDRGDELVTARWTYGVAAGIGSVFCDAAGVTVELGGRSGEHRIDRIDPAGLSVRRLVAVDPAQAEPIAEGGQARLVTVQATRDGLSLRKRQFAPEPPHVAVRDVVIDFAPPVVEKQPAVRKPTGRRRGAERGRR